MSTKKSLFQDAIAEAKTLRAAAIKNAYKTLEENVTPSIKEMLAKQLEEEVDLNEGDEEEDLNEDVNAGFKKVSPKKTVKEAEEEEPVEEPEEEPAEEPEEEPAEEPAEEPEEEPADEEPEVPAEGEPVEEPSDDTPISDLTVGELKDLIASVAAPVAEPAPEGEMGADMDAGDVEGMGDEEAPLEGEPEQPEQPVDPATNAVSPEEENDDEIDLSELLKELENESSKDQRGKYTRGEANGQDHEEEHSVEEGCCGRCKEKDPLKGQEKFQKIQEENAQLKQELDEAYSTISTLRTMIADTNLLNSKLMHTSKLLSKNLSESQKARVIKSLDGAKNLSEVKVIYKTLCESLTAKPSKTTLKEHRSTVSASSPAGHSTAPRSSGLIVETDFVRRMQQLAGIIK